MTGIQEKYLPVIGLEIHSQLNTNTKAFCGCSAKHNSPPNTNVCPVCLGSPGALPVLNKKAVYLALKAGIALNCRINYKSVFARKNYFYPDLPKGYQITQYETPLCYDGSLEIPVQNNLKKRIGIERIHIEEDAGKSIHEISETETLLDFNRCGIPLIEIVTKPEINSPEEAEVLARKIRRILTFLNICDGNMEEGSLRFDANISLKHKDKKEQYGKTEIKNLNSFKYLKDALNLEIQRQKYLIESENKIKHNTINYDANNKKIAVLRTKEEEEDYRYFPEPDLIPLKVTKELIAEIKNSIQELPEDKKERFIIQYQISESKADILTRNKMICEYFEHTINLLKIKNTEQFKNTANWILREVIKELNESKSKSIDDFPVKPKQLSSLLDILYTGKINIKTAKEVFQIMIQSKDEREKDPEYIIKSHNFYQIQDESEIEDIIIGILKVYTEETNKYRSGEHKIEGFLIGKIMKLTEGRANPETVNKILKKIVFEVQSRI